VVKIISLKTYGVREWEMTLEHGSGRMATMKRILDDIADDMMDAIAATIRSQGRRGGGSWPVLDPDTVKRKAGGGAKGMLVDTGDLFRAYTNRGDEHQELSITNQTIYLGTTLEYPKVHQFGSEHVPQRKFISFTRSDKEKWTERVQAELRRAVVGGA
jgi:phage gpG-like protein